MDIETVQRNVAIGRLLLAAAALIAVCLGGLESRFAVIPTATAIHGSALAGAVLVYAAYAIAVWSMVTGRWSAPRRSSPVTVWCDVAFGAILVAVTGGVSSPFFAFVVFAVVSAGLSSGFRDAIVVTGVNVALMLSFVVVAKPDDWSFYVMRPAYLAVTGWLIAIASQQQRAIEARMQSVEQAIRRQRAVARRLRTRSRNG